MSKSVLDLLEAAKYAQSAAARLISDLAGHVVDQRTHLLAIERRLNPALDTTGYDNATLGAEWLRQAFESTAEWRRRVAERRPDDTRNGEAATLLDKLVASIDQMNMATLRDYHDVMHGDEGISASETEQEMLRAIGVSSWPETAEQFVRGFLSKD
jgi:hypothetical protein